VKNAMREKGEEMTEPRYTHSMTPEELYQLLLYQANQFEIFKEFVIENFDLKHIMGVEEFHELFKEYKEMNKGKHLHNLIMLKPKLNDMKINISLI
jgi:hypothetical protein